MSPRRAPGSSTNGGPSRRTLGNTPTGLPYGQHQQLERAQQAMPAVAAPPPAQSPGAPTGARGPDLEQLAGEQPGNVDVRGHPRPLLRPTERPDEPLTAGMALGPGGGPQPLQLPTPPDELGLFLRELYRAAPSEDVRALIVQHEAQPRRRQAPVMPAPAPVPGGLGRPPPPATPLAPGPTAGVQGAVPGGPAPGGSPPPAKPPESQPVR